MISLDILCKYFHLWYRYYSTKKNHWQGEDFLLQKIHFRYCVIIPALEEFTTEEKLLYEKLSFSH